MKNRLMTWRGHKLHKLLFNNNLQNEIDALFINLKQNKTRKFNQNQSSHSDLIKKYCEDLIKK